MLSFLMCQWVKIKGIINGKAGKAAALHKCSDMLTLYYLNQGGRLCVNKKLPPKLQLKIV